MKLLLLLLLSLPLFGEDFSVSKAGGDKKKLMEVYEAVRLLEVAKNQPARPISSVEVMQKIDDKTFLVYHRKKVVTGSVLSGETVVYLNKWETDYDQIYCYKADLASQSCR